MQQRNSEAQPFHMAVVGDSLAYGTGAGSTHLGFAYRLYTRLREGKPQSTYVNVAVPGATMADVTSLQVPQLRKLHPNVVLIVAGANDMLQTSDVGMFSRRYARMIEAVRAAAPRARIIASGMPDVSATLHVPAFAKGAASALCATLNEEMHRVAMRQGAIFLDLFALTNPAAADHYGKYLSADGFHPSAQGYAELAKAAYPILETALQN
jgi:lysophospholipase L1-like esterase